MPLPEGTPTKEIPDGFDPDLHCGAINKAGGVCMADVGFGTEHLGVGRCKWHSGSGETKALAIKRRVGPTILERARQIKTSPDLLELEEQIAYWKAVWERQAIDTDQAWQAYELMKARILAGDYDDDHRPEMPALPDTDPTVTKIISELVTKVFNMRFERKFSIPVTEVESVMMQIKSAFERVCAKYQLPAAVKMEFATELKKLQFSRPVDYQLDRAGGVKQPEFVNEIEREEVAS